MPTPCFWLDPTGDERRWLRRFTFSNSQAGPCPGRAGGHEARTLIGDGPITWVTPEGQEWAGVGPRYMAGDQARPDRSDPRWPLTCEQCGYAFQGDDEWQLFNRQLYRRADNGELVTSEDAPPGALWDAWWLPDNYRGADGIALMAKTPGGDWTVDGKASNSEAPRGWTRTGDPRNPPSLSVTPSIIAGSYHGFLTAGVLSDG